MSANASTVVINSSLLHRSSLHIAFWRLHFDRRTNQLVELRHFLPVSLQAVFHIGRISRLHLRRVTVPSGLLSAVVRKLKEMCKVSPPSVIKAVHAIRNRDGIVIFVQLGLHCCIECFHFGLDVRITHLFFRHRHYGRFGYNVPLSSENEVTHSRTNFSGDS